MPLVTATTTLSSSSTSNSRRGAGGLVALPPATANLKHHHHHHHRSRTVKAESQVVPSSKEGASPAATTTFRHPSSSSSSSRCLHFDPHYGKQHPPPAEVPMLGGATYTGNPRPFQQQRNGVVGADRSSDTMVDKAHAARHGGLGGHSPEVERGRNSRHIPLRDAMDMNVASMLLTTGGQLNTSGCAPGGSAGSVAGTPTAAGSGHESTDQRHLQATNVSTDASLLSNESSSFIAEQFEAQSGHRFDGGVLRFGRERPVASQTTGPPSRTGSRSASAASSASAPSSASRPFNTRPSRVLEAPGVTAAPTLHWGPGNQLAIGLRGSLYCWDAATTAATELVTLAPPIGGGRESGPVFDAVHWTDDGRSVLTALDSGSVSLLDAEMKRFTTTLRGSAEGCIVSMSVSGPIVAIGLDTPLHNLMVYDTRRARAHIRTLEGHHRGITSARFCGSEPFYLGTGGVDGAASVWDVRQPLRAPRYHFASFQTPSSRSWSPQLPVVSAIAWNPEKRTQLLAGTSDGVLRVIDTHARAETCVLRAVDTRYSISGIVTAPNTGELLTSHTARPGIPAATDGLGGHLQHRRIDTLARLATYAALGTEHDIHTMTLAPDRKTVCAAQLDETVKFWDVFDADRSSASHFRRPQHPSSSSCSSQPLGGRLSQQRHRPSTGRLSGSLLDEHLR